MEGRLADKTSQLIMDALGRALADPGGLPLFAGKNSPGLFPTGAAAKRAAQHCKDQGFLQILRTETRGKSSQEVCILSECGLAFLLDQLQPKSVLEKLVAGLEARKSQLDQVVDAARQTQTTLDRFRTLAEAVLEEVRESGIPNQTQAPPVESLAAGTLAILRQWQGAGNLEDCSVPELYWRL